MKIYKSVESCLRGIYSTKQKKGYVEHTINDVLMYADKKHIYAYTEDIKKAKIRNYKLSKNPTFAYLTNKNDVKKLLQYLYKNDKILYRYP